MTYLLWYCIAAVAINSLVAYSAANNQYLHGATKNKWLVAGFIASAPITSPVMLIILTDYPHIVQ